MERKKEEVNKMLPRKRVAVIRTIAIREKSLLYEGRSIRTPKDAVRLAEPFVENADREYLLVCCLDGRSQPVSMETVAIGTVSQCLVGMREVFKNAVISNAASIILFHNHPSGNTEPSQEDMETSRKLRQAGELLDIKVLDHIILGKGSFQSLAGTLSWHTWKEKTA